MPSRSPAARAARLLADKRGRWARRFRTLLDAHLADLGTAAPSAAQCSLARRVTTLELGLENIEAQLAALPEGEPVPAALLDLYARAGGTLKRLLEGLGIERQPRDVTPTIDQYLSAARAIAPANQHPTDHEKRATALPTGSAKGSTE
jgi:hypothetical protein